MPDIIIETSSGRLRGTSENGIHAFKGIPYGGPTGGANRFLPPVPAEPWSGVRDATSFGPACWQAQEYLTRIGIFGAVGIDAMSEDCLALNVWTPAVKDGSKRPVMFWIHGGGFFEGSGDHFPSYDGASLARSGDVVVVTVNHRLGVFGFLHLEGLAGEKYAGSGNAGMLDLVAALTWVRDNIETFGGDPGKVMIFGESGGGAKVSTLLAMPSAQGLFHRAVVQSGPGLRALSREDAAKMAAEFLDITGNRDRIERLHAMRSDTIWAAWMVMAKPPAIPGMPRGGEFAPVVDDASLPAHPFDPVAAPTAANVPLMIGTNKDEMTFMLMRDPEFGKYDEATMRARLVDTLKSRLSDNLDTSRVDDLIAAYRRSRPGATPHDLLVAITTDRMRVASIRLAERKAAGGPAPAFMYQFTWESPAMRGRLKSCHALEIPFVFNNVDPTVRAIGDAPERIALAKAMSQAWIAFARSGDPSHQGLPQWPAYDAKTRATMIFNQECRVQNDPAGQERKAWDGIL